MAAAQARQPFSEHIQELRRRLVWSVLSLLGGALLGYWWRDAIFAALIKPLNQPLYYSAPAGGFNFLLQICLFFGFVLAVPVFIYHLLKFLEPTLRHRSRGLFIKFFVASSLLAFVGLAFAYFVSLPAALHFLGEFGNENIKSLISTSEYFSFAMVYLGGFALLFQLPLIMLFINRITPLPPGRLMRKQRLVVLVSFIAAAVITPTPDPLNQAIMAGPIILLYQISVALIWLANRRHYSPPSEVASLPSPIMRPLPAQTSQAPAGARAPQPVDLRHKEVLPVDPLPAVPRANVLDLRQAPNLPPTAI